MTTTSNEILDIEQEEIIRMPIYGRLSFASGLMSLMFFGYFMYAILQVAFNKEDLGHMRIIRSASFLIVFGMTYVLSLIFLIISYLRKEKSVLKILASIGHGFILFSIVVAFVKEILG